LAELLKNRSASGAPESPSNAFLGATVADVKSP
jgi:hypothetical protein